MQNRLAPSRLENFLRKAAIAVPVSGRAQRRILRSAATRTADFLNAFVEKHTALAAALLVNASMVLLLCFYSFRGPHRGSAFSLSFGSGFLIEESGNDEESGDNSDVAEESPSKSVSYPIPSVAQPVAAMATPKPALLPTVIEALAASRSLYTGGGRAFGLGEGAGGRGGGKKIGGLMVQANRLGVILDVSGSMADDSERVNRIIAEQFENAICVQVEGCDLLLATHTSAIPGTEELPFNFGHPAPGAWTTQSAWPDPKPKQQKKEWPWAEKPQPSQPAPEPVIVSESSGTIQALLILANRGVDAVYWFCDLQDLQSNDALREVERILRAGRIRLYVQSQEVEPGPVLREIIAGSGGTYSVEF